MAPPSQAAGELNAAMFSMSTPGPQANGRTPSRSGATGNARNQSRDEKPKPARLDSVTASVTDFPLGVRLRRHRLPRLREDRHPGTGQGHPRRSAVRPAPRCRWSFCATSAQPAASGCRGQGDRQRPGDVGDAGSAVPQPVRDRAPRRVRQGRVGRGRGRNRRRDPRLVGLAQPSSARDTSSASSRSPTSSAGARIRHASVTSSVRRSTSTSASRSMTSGKPS
jgi:hypothetical protein